MVSLTSEGSIPRAFDDGFQNGCAKGIGWCIGESAAKAADSGPGGGYDYYICHKVSPR